MTLIHSFEKEGNVLFRYRGQIPVLLFVLAIPAVLLHDYPDYHSGTYRFVNWLSAILSLIGFLIRAYTIGTTPRGTSGRNTETQVAEQLNRKGIYSIVRHPLYLGNYLMWIGIVLFTKNYWFVAVVSLLYWIYYERIMFAEERFLEKKFGNAFVDWSLKVPAFIPAFSGFVSSGIPFSIRSVLRREYSGVLATVIGYCFVELLIGWRLWKTIHIGKTFLVVLIATTIITILLRFLKRSTKLLNEEGRS